MYGSWVTHQPDYWSGPKLWRRLTDTFGYLTREGFVDDGGKAWTFATVVGEIGSGACPLLTRVGSFLLCPPLCFSLAILWLGALQG